MKPVECETGMQFSRYPLVASVPNHYNYYYYYNPSLCFARNEKHTTRLETMDIMRRFYEALAKKQRFFSLAYLTKQEEYIYGNRKR